MGKHLSGTDSALYLISEARQLLELAHSDASEGGNAWKGDVSEAIATLAAALEGANIEIEIHH